MRTLKRFVPCLAGLALAMVAVPSRGDGQLPRAAVAGAWQYDGTPEQGARIVRDAVEPTVLALRPDLQSIARERIAESTWLPTRITIRAPRGRVQIALRGAPRGRTFASPLGRPVQVPRARPGEYAEMTQTIRSDGAIEQVFVALDGTQRNVYAPGPGGTMRLDVTLQSPALRGEIRFGLAYRRAR